MADESINTVVDFLKNRNVEENVIIQFENEKMDCLAINSSPESVLEGLGLTRKGDIYALKAMCKRKHEHQHEDLEKRKLRLLQECYEGKQDRVKRDTARPKNQEKTRKVSLGWKHFDNKKERFINVTVSKGGGPRMLDVPCSTDKMFLIEEGKKLFFPDGESHHGSVEDMTFDLVNFKGDVIHDTSKDFTVQKYFEQHKLSKLSLYLPSVPRESNSIENKGQTWRKNLNIALEESHGEMYQDIEDSNDEDDDDDNSKAFCTSNTTHAPSTSTLLGSSDERMLLKQQQEDELEQSLKADREKERQAVEALENEVKKVERLEKLRDAREKRVPPEPEKDQERVRVIVQHISRGKVMRFFPKEENVLVIYDWVGSLDIEPEQFELCVTTQIPTFTTVRVQPSEKIQAYDGCIFYMNAVDDPILLDENDPTVNFKAFGTANPNDATLEEPAISVELPDHIMVDDSDSSEDSEVWVKNEQNSSMKNLSGDARLKMTNIKGITIRRDGILEELLHLYRDVQFCQNTYPFFSFEGELGEDHKGLKREVYTAFWERAFLSFFEGAAGSYIPRTSSDITDELLVCLGRIAAHGYVICGVFPVQICKAFMVSSLCGNEALTDEDLLSSLLSFHTDKERCLLEGALACKDTSFTNEVSEALMDVLEVYNLRKLPKPSTLKGQLIGIARCEFIQKASWAAQSFKQGIADCHNISQNTSKQELDHLYVELVPTSASVLEMLELEEEESQITSGKKVVWSYFKRFVRNADETVLRKVLRFVTGSDLVTVDKISVVFHTNIGNIPEIVAHTCSAVLDLPTSGYMSYNDFQTQLLSMFSNPLSWEFNVV